MQIRLELIRNQKLKTPQLLEALQKQERTGGLLGKILLEKELVTQNDIDDALRYQGYQPLVDTQGLEVTPAPASSNANPSEILEHLLGLAARKGASDIHLEPTDTELAIKLRIDGLFYKIKLLRINALVPMLARIHELFELNAARKELPQRGRAHLELDRHDFDLLVHTLPTRLGMSVTIKLVDRRFFLKNFTALGLTPADQLFLVRALDAPSGLIDDDVVLAHGSSNQIRAEGRQHQAIDPVGSSVRAPNGSQPGPRTRFPSRPAFGRGRRSFVKPKFVSSLDPRPSTQPPFT